MPHSDSGSCGSAQEERDWPAPAAQVSAAREFLQQCAESNTKTLLLPDKDADGLCSGLIVYLTLTHLGLEPEHISVHFPAKGSNVHEPAERAAISGFDVNFVIVTDQGSRGGPSIAEGDVPTLIIDHHWSTVFPDGALVCSAARCPPVATSATLAYDICKPLLQRCAGGSSAASSRETLMERLDYLCAMGTMGDLGTSFKWEPPFPNMRDCLKKWTKKVLGEAIGLINAPRRTGEYDVETAWRALLHASTPRDLVDPASSKDVRRLFAARADVKAAVDRVARQPPKFSGDGRVALIRISSPAQVHPLIATRWSSSLKGARLEVVMCANDGYSPGMTNFACRIARAGGGTAHAGAKRKAQGSSGGDVEGETDIIAILKEYASRVPGLRESMGDNFARGHKQASGGIVRTEDFEKLWETMLSSQADADESPAKRRKVAAKGSATQKNTLEGWLKKA
ncbi:DHH phosphoesterase [Trametes sanguinea]|nr:DHH phosphoesterase [Trametes sanguinea]